MGHKNVVIIAEWSKGSPLGGGEGLPYISYIAPKGVVLRPFWSEIGYCFCALLWNWVWFLEAATFSLLSSLEKSVLTETLHRFESYVFNKSM